MIHASLLSLPDFFLIETDSLKVLNSVKLSNIVQVEWVSLFTMGAVYLLYVSLWNCTLQCIFYMFSM